MKKETFTQKQPGRWLLVLVVLLAMSSAETAKAQTLNCQVNIDATHHYLQFGPPGGTGQRWIMKGTHSTCIRMNPSGGHWEDDYNHQKNFFDRNNQLESMKAAGINTVRIWVPCFGCGPVNGYANLSSGAQTPVTSNYEGYPATLDGNMQMLVDYAVSAKNKGLFVIIESWSPYDLSVGSSLSYFQNNVQYIPNLVQKLVAANCDNVMFGTGNEPTSDHGANWGSNSFPGNTSNFVAFYRQSGFTGPVLCDSWGNDDSPAQLWEYTTIVNNDPNRNVAFQEHVYANLLKIGTQTLSNGQTVMSQFPVLMTELNDITTSGMDEIRGYIQNNNYGGVAIFDWNAADGYQITNPASYGGGDGLNITGNGNNFKNHIFDYFPGGFLGNTGNPPTGGALPI